MMYKVYFSDHNGPRPGLSPVWLSLHGTDGASKLASAPTIREIGGGWYAFDLQYGSEPWDEAELVGVIDAGEELVGVQRAVPVSVSLRDLGMAFLTNTRRQTIASGLIEIMDDDGVTTLLTLTPSEADGRDVLTPSGGGG